MSEASEETSTESNAIKPAVSGPMSDQATSMIDTIFAETMGLGMHNAISSQLNSQMTTAASVTSACARLLKTPAAMPHEPEKKASGPKGSKIEPTITDIDAVHVEAENADTGDTTEPTDKWYKRLFKRNKANENDTSSHE